MKKTLIIFLLIPLLGRVTCRSSFAQHYSFKNYTTEHGLPQNQIYSMCQDSKGFIWFGTNGRGVARYDGYSFQTFTKKDGLANNVLNVIIEDSKENLWFGTLEGISKLSIHNYKNNDVVFENYTTEDGLINNNVLTMIEDNKGIIWFGTEGGLSRINITKRDSVKITFNNYTTSDGLFNNRVRSLMQDNNENLWIGYDDGGLSMLKFQDEERSLFSVKHYNIYEKISKYDIRAILEDNDKNIWVALNGGGIVIFNPDNTRGNIYENINTYNGLPGNYVWKMIIDKSGNIWAGTWGNGVSKIIPSYDNNFTYQIENFSVSDGLSNNNVESMLEDNEDNLWFGTIGESVSKLVNQTYELHTIKSGLFDNFIWVVFEDSKGNIWTGTNNGGISVLPFSQKGKTEKRYLSMLEKDGLVNNRVHFLYEDDESNIWIGTYKGISIIKYNDITETFRIIRNINSENGLIDEFVRAIYEDKSGNIWIGTHDGGVYTLNKSKIITGNYEVENITTENGLVNNRVFSISEDSKGNIWFATAGGVSKYNGNTFENFTDKSGLINNDVRTVLKDKEGKLWFGTGGGISIFDPATKTFENLTSKDGLSSDRLYLMHIDRNDSILWVGTNIGIDKFNLAEYRRSGKKIFWHLTHLDGFVEKETNTNAVCQDKDGNLWFGTIDGLIKYYPNYEKPKNTIKPKTYITKISINKKDTMLSSNAIISYHLNSFAFHYVGISLTMPEKVRYQYKLEGFDEEWSPITKERYTMYGNLPHGKYTFMVKACNNDGVWNKEPTTFSFTITPAFWQTWWFYVLCVLTGSGGIYGFVKIRERNLRQEKRILEKKVKQRTVVIEKQKEELAVKNKDITDSIRYASNIQQAILPPVDDIRKILPDSFILFKPKDIVSGDFYFYAKVIDTVVLAACDCTGHGVPGAFMSMIGSRLLDEIVNDKSVTNADEILNQLRGGIIHSFGEAGATGEQKDGMDMALCTFQRDKDNSIVNLQYAGAYNPLYIVRPALNKVECGINNNKTVILNEAQRSEESPDTDYQPAGDSSASPQNDKYELTQVHADKQPVGYHYGKQMPFTNHEIQLNKGDTVYIFSDGYQDQFGGPRGKKFMSKRFRRLFLDIQEMSMEEQKEHLEQVLNDWKGNKEQVDDILVIGVRV